MDPFLVVGRFDSYFDDCVGLVEEVVMVFAKLLTVSHK